MITRGETARRRRAAPPPASLPDDDDLLREILLRLPPRPSSLPRASLVCKRWRSLVADPQFQRRFRDHYPKPPLLGFFVEDHSSSFPFVPMLDGPDRIPCDRFSMPPQSGDHIMDCRHGLVLLLSSMHRGKDEPSIRILVWDPVAREQHRLILPPELDNDQIFIFNGTMLRPAGGHRHFQVALAARYLGPDTRVLACLYSSEIGTWSNIISLQPQWFIVRPEPSTLIGNSICWLLKLLNHDHRRRYVTLEFDLHRQSLDMTELPPHMQDGYHKLRIMRAEDGGLGFIHLSGFHAELWKRKPDSDGLAVWVLDRAIEFKELSSTWKGYSLFLVGFAEESNAILLKISSCFFIFYLQSMEYKKLANLSFFYRYYPFEYCYASGTSIVDGYGGDEVNNM